MSTEFGIFWGETLFDNIRSKKPIIENFLYENDAMCIQGKPGCCKSLIVQQILFDLTTGTDWLDTYPVPRKFSVCWIQTEGDRDETKERIDNMAKARNVDHTQWAHAFYEGLKINVDSQFKRLENDLLSTKINFDVLIIDPLYLTVKGKLTEDDVCSDWIRNIRLLKSHFYPCAIIATHHLNKEMYHKGEKVDRGDGNVYGAFGWEAFFNVVYKLKFQNKTKMVTLSAGKGRSSKEVRKVDMKLVEPVPLYFTTDETNVPLSSSLVQVYIRKHDKLTRRQLINEMGADGHDISESSIDRAIRKEKDNNTVETFYEDGNKYMRWVLQTGEKREDL